MKETDLKHESYEKTSNAVFPHLYFLRYEEKKPNKPLEYSPQREMIFRILSIANLIFGANYLIWRWTNSLNPEALVFSITLALAETLSYTGLILLTYNLWYDQKIESIPILEFLSSYKKRQVSPSPNLPISVDIYITTYNEHPDLVQLSIQDAKSLRVPEDLALNIYVLDDGQRGSMEELAHHEEVHYITRMNNKGFKAGNLCNALQHSKGDFIVICDADTRLFPEFLEKTLGFFKDPKVGWVQTPQWFYDITDGIPLSFLLRKIFGKGYAFIGKFLDRHLKNYMVFRDPFFNEGTMFYDIIMRRRNKHNASFCCGAASVHRRECLYQVAITQYLKSGGKTEFSPFKLHISEDIYTSLIIHNTPGWKSVYFPEVLSKMLSPQDFLTRYKQLFRYATGTLDIARKDFPLFMKNLTISQKLMYMTTIYSYLSSIWVLVFLISPIVYLFTEVSPVYCSYEDFLKKLIPFLLLNEMAQMIGCWGTSQFKNRAFSIGVFSINLKALFCLIFKRQLQFNVTPKMGNQREIFLQYISPHLCLIFLSLGGIIYSLYQYISGNFYSPLGVLVINHLWVYFNIAALGRFSIGALWINKR